jgi:beta-glucanase (GH16 family)
MKSRLGVLLVLAVLGPALVGVTSAPAQAAVFTARLSRAIPITGEHVKVFGAVMPATRPVTLQLYRSGSWVRVATKRTTAGGHYAFAVTATSTARVFRVLAPRARIKVRKTKRTYPARHSNNVRVLGQAPSLALGIAAAPVGQLSTGTAMVTPGVATFRPARPGAAVAVQQLVDGSWKTVVTGGRQNSAGQFRFNVRTGSDSDPATFRAVTSPGSGVPTVTSPWVKPDHLPEEFADDFSGTALDATKWQTREQDPGGLRKCSEPSADRVSVGAGVATLSIRKASGATSDCPYGFYENAMIGTRDADPGFTATHGVFAARVKFQSGAGQHGSFWLQGAPGTGAEIDAAEYFGDGTRGGGFSNFVHYTPSIGAEPVTSGGLKPLGSILGAGKTPSNGFHVYSVEWNSSGYIFRVDGMPTFSTNQPFVATSPEFMVLSLLTSDGELHSLTSASSTMQVDWVRAWRRPDA